MAFNNSLSTRLEELRSRNPQSTTSENPTGYTAPSRYSGSFMASHSHPSNDVRASLQRRFTTDLGKMPTLTPIGQQPNQVVDPLDISSTTLHKVQLLEKKRMEYEMLREQRRRFEAELELFNLQQAREKQELDQMAQDLSRVNLSAGHQSEPTTPPEYREHVFPSVFSRNNRYSASNLASPPGLNNRSSRSGSQLTSPPTELAQTLHNHINSDTLPSKSVPGSRRGSNDRVSAYIPEISGTGQRTSASTHRYSMPVTGSRKRHSEVADYSSVMGLGHINTTGFLFGDDDEKSSGKKESTTSPDVKSYLQMNATDDKFPILVRREEYPGLLSASSAALDLALSQSPGPEAQLNGWSPFARHRHSQHSLPQNVFNPQANGQANNVTPTTVAQQPSEVIGNSRQNRHSMEASLASYSQASLPSQTVSNDSGRPTLANIQSSYSTNDIPTMKSTNGLGGIVTPTKTQAQQHFHNHNASLGRIPLHAVNNRHSRELSGGEARREEPSSNYQYLSSALQASAAPFGPSTPTASPTESVPNGLVQMNANPQYAMPAFYGGYGMQVANMGMGPIQMSNPLAFNNQMPAFQPQNPFAQYQNFGQPPRFADSQARVIQQRRLQNGEDNARFINVKLEHLQGEIYGLCKDQHGCRYLQKKLEERNPEHVHIIFLETNQHVVELMTDPFGNYLCQKLLEFSNDDQRTVLINNAAPQMVKIALNQHGTRALQKMIEFISTREQIQTIIHALQDRVVELIQDLNGNHVIQKCLNRLSPDDAQFIFDGVGNNCIVVGTHRHGCCVLQRCIDHASGLQKAQLISQITANAFSLVQDPFGNYVVQYIVDLAEPAFTDPLCYSFQGSIPLLSKQKFSSNVIEKCLRGAQASVTKMMIEEMLNTNELEKMLSDSFANYVVQTALDYADPETKNRLVEAIRPILPSIRQTPYGRRIQSKIIGSEGQSRGRLSGGPATPNDGSTGQIPLAKSMHSGSTANPYAAAVNGFQGLNNTYINPNTTSYQSNGNLSHVGPYAQSSSSGSAGHSQTFSNGSSYTQFSSDESNPNPVQQPTPAYARAPPVNGFNYF
ncbi:hypothetical protein MMC07_009913 [Pseudocyphellaria aurata]|nr:hypothetical protein [Pseudocyphellaria aurata]